MLGQLSWLVAWLKQRRDTDAKALRPLRPLRSLTVGSCDTVSQTAEKLMSIRFADCVLDTAARRLVRAGGEVHLPPKAFELLTLLVESRPRAVAKDELLERIWPGVFVSDASLAKAISRIREAIGDSDAAPILRTVHGFGYAFAATVEDDQPRPERAEPPPPPRCWLFCGAREFPLHDGEHIVGREPGAAICLDSPKVSRRHARFIVDGVSATLEDLGSKNGSFVRGVRISAPTPLQSGDHARIGPFTLIFRVGAYSGSTQTEMR
jgi:DNA-binding winged helix-turn-helix (wHTH) protein